MLVRDAVVTRFRVETPTNQPFLVSLTEDMSVRVADIVGEREVRSWRQHRDVALVQRAVMHRLRRGADADDDGSQRREADVRLFGYVCYFYHVLS